MNALLVATAEQPADRLARDFAEDVPERDIDAADGVGDRSAASEPEGVLVEFFGEALRLVGPFTEVERREHIERCLDESDIGENGTGAGNAGIGVHDDQRVNGIIFLKFRAPAAFGRRPGQPDRPNLPNPHQVRLLNLDHQIWPDCMTNSSPAPEAMELNRRP